MFCVDAKDLGFEVLSSTSLKATVILPDKSAADYAEVQFRRSEFSDRCTKYSAPYSCIYTDLKPGQRYDFVYLLGSMTDGRDIMSKNRYKSFTMPS